jgi:palmitoyl-protein thioesterase
MIQSKTASPTFCIEIGNGIETTWHEKFSNQAREACQKVMENKVLFTSPEINAIGFSQGGLLARYIAQGCDIKGKVRNLVTVGTPNMGYVDPPKCQPFANNLYETYIKKLE